MSQQDNLTVVREIYEAVGRGDVAAILDRVSDDVDWAADVITDAVAVVGDGTGAHRRRIRDATRSRGKRHRNPRSSDRHCRFPPRVVLP